MNPKTGFATTAAWARLMVRAQLGTTAPIAEREFQKAPTATFKRGPGVT